MRYSFYILCFVLLCTLSSCSGGGGSGASSNNSSTPPNEGGSSSNGPQISLNADQIRKDEGQIINLTAVAGGFPNQNNVTYTWSLSQGTGNLNATGSTATLALPEVSSDQTLTVNVSASDGSTALEETLEVTNVNIVLSPTAPQFGTPKLVLEGLNRPRFPYAGSAGVEFEVIFLEDDENESFVRRITLDYYFNQTNDSPIAVRAPINDPNVLDFNVITIEGVYDDVTYVPFEITVARYKDSNTVRFFDDAGNVMFEIEREGVCAFEEIGGINTFMVGSGTFYYGRKNYFVLGTKASGFEAIIAPNYDGGVYLRSEIIDEISDPANWSFNTVKNSGAACQIQTDLFYNFFPDTGTFSDLERNEYLVFAVYDSTNEKLEVVADYLGANGTPGMVYSDYRYEPYELAITSEQGVKLKNFYLDAELDKNFDSSTYRLDIINFWALFSDGLHDGNHSVSQIRVSNFIRSPSETVITELSNTQWTKGVPDQAGFAPLSDGSTLAVVTLESTPYMAVIDGIGTSSSAVSYVETGFGDISFHLSGETAVGLSWINQDLGILQAFSGWNNGNSPVLQKSHPLLKSQLSDKSLKSLIPKTE